MFCRILKANPLSVAQIIRSSQIIGKQINKASFRSLYTSYGLGLEGFALQSERIRNEINFQEDKFITKMEQILESTEEKDVVFTDDLKQLIALCQKNNDYLQLVLGLSLKHSKNAEKLGIKMYAFGPIVMRLFYSFKCTDEALKLLLEKDIGNLFHQASSYQLAMDLLYEESRYDDVQLLMDNILQRNLFSLPTSCVTLAVAANYKKNTDEALQKSLDLVRRLSEDRKSLTFRMLGFVACLALNKNEPMLALETLSQASSSEHFVINNLKISSLVSLGQIQDVLDMLRIKTLVDIPKHKRSSRHIYSHDVINKIEKKVNESLESNLISDFQHLKSILKNMDLISPASLDEALCSPIENIRGADKNRNSFTRNQKSDFRNQRYSNTYNS